MPSAGKSIQPPADGALLVINAGSSSVKFAVFAPDRLEAITKGRIDGLPDAPRFRAQGPEGARTTERAIGRGGPLEHAAAIEQVISWLDEVGLGPARGRLAGVGHRVVHGGPKHDRPVLVDAAIMRELAELTPLAPLHQPHNLEAIRAVERAAPGLRQVACFDTAFHRTQPTVAQRIGLPRGYEARGVRRYGFHGLSYESIGAALPGVDAGAAAGRTIIAHLGAGASLCALKGGRSIATTMGFSSLDGLVMGTRCGAIDPGVLLYLEAHEGMSTERMERLLYEESGLLGVSGVSGDMRTLIESREPGAREAIELFVYRAVREMGSLAAALGGLDALVFTGGIGENAPSIRRAIGDGCVWLGVHIDGARNERGAGLISAEESRVRAWVIPTDEELMIARHTSRVLGKCT